MLRCRPSTPSEAGRSTTLSFVAPRKADPRCLRQLADAMLGCPQFRSTRFHCAARETEFCRQRLAGDIGRRPRGERSEFGSQTVARLANRPELRGFLSSGKRGRFRVAGFARISAAVVLVTQAFNTTRSISLFLSRSSLQVVGCIVAISAVGDFINARFISKRKNRGS